MILIWWKAASGLRLGSPALNQRFVPAHSLAVWTQLYTSATQTAQIAHITSKQQRAFYYVSPVCILKAPAWLRLRADPRLILPTHSTEQDSCMIASHLRDIASKYWIFRPACLLFETFESFVMKVLTFDSCHRCHKQHLLGFWGFTHQSGKLQLQYLLPFSTNKEIKSRFCFAV